VPDAASPVNELLLSIKIVQPLVPTSVSDAGVAVLLVESFWLKTKGFAVSVLSTIVLSAFASIAAMLEIIAAHLAQNFGARCVSFAIRVVLLR
jgi:hypothetical protein